MLVAKIAKIAKISSYMQLKWNSFYMYNHTDIYSNTFIALLQPSIFIHRLLDEIDDVLGDRITITADDLDNLKYTEQV